jgi:hypothetical protein
MKKTSANAVRAMNMTPIEWWGMGKKAGEVGIEIEVEGRLLPRAIPKYWKAIEDGSLRGESAEYVLSQPIKRDKVPEALDVLSQTLNEARAVVNESYRTSVHIHVNHQDITFRQIINEICLYVIFEDMLVEMCGKDRIGNLFCLRVKDAEFIIDTLRNAIQRGDYTGLGDNQALKYGAINIAALRNYGSLEYRAFRGTVDPKLINDWVETLLKIKDAALRFDDPQQIVRQFSHLGAQRFVEDVFGAKAQYFLEQPNLEERLFAGVRDVQEIAYAVPTWELKLLDAPVENRDQYGGDVAVDNNIGRAIQWVLDAAPQPVERFRNPRPAPIIIHDDAAIPAVQFDINPDADDFDEDDL